MLPDIAAVTMYCVAVIFISAMYAFVRVFLDIFIQKALNGFRRSTLLTVVAAQWIVSVCGPGAASVLPDFAIDTLYKPITGHAYRR